MFLMMFMVQAPSFLMTVLPGMDDECEQGQACGFVVEEPNTACTSTQYCLCNAGACVNDQFEPISTTKTGMDEDPSGQRFCWKQGPVPCSKRYSCTPINPPAW